jgi:hypothetical protein
LKSRCQPILLPTSRTPSPQPARPDGGAVELIDAVARQAGVAPQSFYLHVATIDELLWDVYAREWPP